MHAATGTGKYERLLARCEGLAPVPTAVAHPCEATALGGAVEAAQKGLIAPLLVGPADKIAEIAESSQIDLGDLPSYQLRTVSTVLLLSSQKPLKRFLNNVN
jgi:phosphate acetyltransferase